MPPLAILSSACVAVLAFGAHLLWMAYVVEPSHKAVLESQIKADNLSCEASKKITEEVSNDYQKKLMALNADLVRLKRLRQSDSRVQSSTSTTGLNEAAIRGQLAGAHGFDDFYDYASEAEGYRIQVIGLQDFINKTWGRK